MDAEQKISAMIVPSKAHAKVLTPSGKFITWCWLMVDYQTNIECVCVKEHFNIIKNETNFDTEEYYIINSPIIHGAIT